MDREEGIRLSREAAERAVQLDPDYSNAHVRLGQALGRDGNTQAMLAQYQLAYELDPHNPLVLGVLAINRLRTQAYDEAVSLYEQAEAADPVGAIWPANKSEVLLFAGRLDESEFAIKRSYDLNGNAAALQRRLMDIAILRKKYDTALEIAAEWPEEGYIVYLSSIAIYHSGREDEAEATLLRAYEMSKNHPRGRIYGRLGTAAGYANMNNFDAAFEWLEQARGDNLPRFVLEINPFLTALHDDPRWLPMLDSYGPPEN